MLKEENRLFQKHFHLGLIQEPRCWNIHIADVSAASSAGPVKSLLAEDHLTVKKVNRLTGFHILFTF